jgi:beta-lactamase superfamily II metal-dependent hydrolase
MKTPASATDRPTLEIHVLGGGKGESIAIKLPDGTWGIVDCYSHSRSDTAANPTYQFLKSEGVKRLRFLCLTHPHEDHFMGMVQLIDEFRPLEFWRFNGLSHEHFRQLIRNQALLAASTAGPPVRKEALSRSAQELLEIRSRVLAGARSETMEPRRLQEPAVALEIATADEWVFRIETLAPTGNQVEKYEGTVFESIDASGRLGVTLTDPVHNLISLVLLISFGQTRVLLGADLERQCWVEVMKKRTDLHASLVKVSHHGSRNGYCDDLWGQFARGESKQPVSVLTPYHRFGLPDAESIDEIIAHSRALYSTCELRRGARASSTPNVASRAALRAAFRSRRVDGVISCGRCCFRFDDMGECSVELHPPACAIDAAAREAMTQTDS